MTAAAIYARQSIDKVDSISIETQIELCRAICECDRVEIYSDKGYSGKNTKRPEFQRMMADIRAGRISKVYVYKLDRITRSLSDFMRIFDELDKYSCGFASRSESFDTTTPFGRAMLQICVVFAELERGNTVQRVKDAYAARMKEGFYMGGRIPYGFKLVETSLNEKKTSMYEAVEEEAEQLRQIFEWYSHPDTTLNGIVKLLHENGITKLRGAAWQTARLSDIIRNPCYVRANAEVYRFFKQNGTNVVNEISEFDGRAAFLFGRRNYGRKFSNIEGQTLVVALHKGIIEPDIWLKCQAKLSRNRQIKRSGLGKNTWLSGIVRCGKCGSTMKLTKSRTKAGRYFNCNGRISLHTCEGHNCTIYADAIEAIVGDEIAERISELEFRRVEDFAAANKELDALNARLASIDDEISKLMDKLADSDETLFKYIEQRINDLDAKRSSILDEIAECKRSSADNVDVLELNKVWADGDFDNKKLIARTLIKEVRIFDNNVEILWKI